MTQRAKQGVTWVAIVTVILGIVGFALANVVASKPELERVSGRVHALEEFKAEAKTDLREIKSDVKLLLQRIPEKR